MMKLTAEQKKTVLAILRKFVSDRKVSVFGSRVNGTTKKFSDLDLLIHGTEPLSFDDVAKLRQAFSESDLPFRVDIMDEASASSEFLGSIKKHIVPIL